MEVKFYRCNHCGQIIAFVENKNVPVVCCGEPMEEIIPGTTEASVEKHIPIYTVTDNLVEVAVGAVDHPMTEDHFIEWVVLRKSKKTIKTRGSTSCMLCTL